EMPAPAEPSRRDHVEREARVRERALVATVEILDADPKQTLLEADAAERVEVRAAEVDVGFRVTPEALGDDEHVAVVAAAARRCGREVAVGEASVERAADGEAPALPLVEVSGVGPEPRIGEHRLLLDPRVDVEVERAEHEAELARACAK